MTNARADERIARQARLEGQSAEENAASSGRAGIGELDWEFEQRPSYQSDVHCGWLWDLGALLTELVTLGPEREEDVRAKGKLTGRQSEAGDSHADK
jgi:hypothetical protein